MRDNKNNKFPVVSFDFLYEAKEAYVNDTTSQVGFYTETTGDSFKGDRLPELWSKRLKETVQKGEALIFSISSSNTRTINSTAYRNYASPCASLHSP